MKEIIFQHNDGLRENNIINKSKSEKCKERLTCNFPLSRLYYETVSYYSGLSTYFHEKNFFFSS